MNDSSNFNGKPSTPPILPTQNIDKKSKNKGKKVAMGCGISLFVVFSLFIPLVITAVVTSDSESSKKEKPPIVQAAGTVDDSLSVTDENELTESPTENASESDTEEPIETVTEPTAEPSTAAPTEKATNPTTTNKPTQTSTTKSSGTPSTTKATAPSTTKSSSTPSTTKSSSTPSTTKATTQPSTTQPSQKPSNSTGYVVNVNTGKVHRSSCKYVNENCVSVSATDIYKYEPCKVCKPF